MSTWTWWAPCPPPSGSLTSSPWWTEPPGGRKPCPCHLPHQQRWPRRSSRAGWPGLARRLTSPLTGAHSSRQTAVAEGLGVKLHRTTAYNPQGTGLCERFHRSMKAALRASLTDSNWADRLPWVMLGLRSAPKEDLQASAAELVYGQPLRVPGEFLPEAASPWSADSHRAVSRGVAGAFVFIPTSPHCVPQSYVPKDLLLARYVFIRHDSLRTPLQPPYDGPFRVLEAGAKNFVVDLGGKPEWVTVDRLKPAHRSVDEPVQLALPRRGRPPAAASGPGCQTAQGP